MLLRDYRIGWEIRRVWTTLGPLAVWDCSGLCLWLPDFRCFLRFGRGDFIKGRQEWRPFIASYLRGLNQIQSLVSSMGRPGLLLNAAVKSHRSACPSMNNVGDTN